MTTHYTHWDVLLASPTEPLPLARRLHQLTKMHQALSALERDDQPTTEDWRVLSDCVNLTETFVQQGVLADHSGLLLDAITALALAGRRHAAGGQIRLDGAGMQSVRAVLEDYGLALELLPARTVISGHRQTEKRLQAILAGKRQPHDVEIVSL